jgi:dTDP-4-amino-4,6-dideoxygalactose transaminase
MNKRIFLSPPHMGGQELEFIQQAFESNYIAPLGPQVDAFEREFAQMVGIGHCVALSSGTAAMHLALKHIGVGPGDEVWASTLTFIGSVSPITFEGGVPVFFDSTVDSWNMDPRLLDVEMARCALLGRLPKVVIPTDLYGQCCDLPRILKICDRYGVPVVCDSAEALGAKFRNSGGDGVWCHAGKGARATVFSFNGNKIITTSGGGMLASDDRALIEQARYLSQQARQPSAHYEHTEIGYNYRMSNIVAAIGLGQLKCLDQRVRRKREIFDAYRAALSHLPGISFMPEAGYGRCSRWLTVILIDPLEFGADREEVRIALENENIESRSVWKPMHRQPVFKIMDSEEVPGLMLKANLSCWPARQVGGQIADTLFATGLCLPSGTAMTQADMQRVVDVIMLVHDKAKHNALQAG